MRERITRKGVGKVMNRVDFMKQLESLLQNISPSEREEALQYYNELNFPSTNYRTLPE